MLTTTEFRSLCKHFFLRGDAAVDIKTELDTVYGASFAPSLQTIEKWLKEFKEGNMSNPQDDGTRSRSSSEDEKS